MVHKNNLTVYTRGKKRANRAISPYNLGEVTLTTWSWTLTNKEPQRQQFNNLTTSTRTGKGIIKL